MIYLFLAEGFEESEAIVPLDILRRAGYTVKTVGVTGKSVTGSHGITVLCDLEKQEITEQRLEAVILPGGMPGTLNLEKDETVQRYIDFAAENKLVIGAICAAPSILGHKGLLKGRQAVCYPGFEKDLTGANIPENCAVCTDENYVTACGAGAAFEFGFALFMALSGDSARVSELKSNMRYRI